MRGTYISRERQKESNKGPLQAVYIQGRYRPIQARCSRLHTGHIQATYRTDTDTKKTPRLFFTKFTYTYTANGS